jgi:uncharacterized protein
MHSMATDRRSVLLGLFCTALPLGQAIAGAPAPPAFLTTGRRDGRFHAMALDGAGHILGDVPLPGRGHGFAVSRDGHHAVAFARRPGRFALPFSPATMQASAPLPLPADRHFYGHGLFSADGKRLFATQNDFDAGRGVLAVHDVRQDYRRIGEFATHGIGPHECLLADDGRSAVIANGGILTHPDWPRRKLNLDTMVSTLVRLDLASGDLLARASLPPALYQLSMRHLAATPDGATWFCCQHQGAATEQPPLIGRWDRNGEIRLIDLPATVTRSMRNYAGSIAATPDGRRIAVTSPRGGIIVVLDGRSGSFLETVSLADTCGIAPTGDGFMATAGTGEILLGGKADAYPDINWDNHMVTLKS